VALFKKNNSQTPKVKSQAAIIAAQLRSSIIEETTEFNAQTEAQAQNKGKKPSRRSKNAAAPEKVGSALPVNQSKSKNPNDLAPPEVTTPAQEHQLDEVPKRSGIYNFNDPMTEKQDDRVEGDTNNEDASSNVDSGLFESQATSRSEIGNHFARETQSSPEVESGRDNGPITDISAKKPHHLVGLSDNDIVAMYQTMLEARLLDQKMWNLNRSGRAPFAISSQGHEATHVGIAAAIEVGIDWILPYYRDLGLLLGLGVRDKDILLSLLAKAPDQMSGGRQMPNHWSVKERNIVTGSSPVATQLPHATGIALGIQIDHGDSVVFTTFGDGGASKGDFHESLNFASIHKLPIVFICENNGYAISVPLESESAVADIATRGIGYNIFSEIVDGNDPIAVYDAVRKARIRAASGNGPSLIEAKTYRFLSHASDDDDRTYRSSQEVADAKANDPLISFGNYLYNHGLMTESLEKEMVEATREAIELALAAAESSNDPDPSTISDHVFAKPIRFDQPASPNQVIADPSAKTVNYIESIRNTLGELLEEFDEAIIMGEDVGTRGGVFKATEGLITKFGQDRVIDTPIAESGLVGFGIGLAVYGKKPIVEIQFGDFIHSAFDQILSEAARICYRSNGSYNVPMVIRAPFGAGVHGGLYHSQSIEAFYAHIPGIKVVVASTPENAAGLLRSALEDPDPVLFLEHKKAYRMIKGAEAASGHRFPIGRAEIVRKGRDLSIIAYGLMRHYCLAVAEELSGMASIEVVDLLTISPLDRATIIDSAKRCAKVLVVHEDNREFGVGAEVVATIMEGAFLDLDGPVERLAPDHFPIAPFAHSLEGASLITPERIKERVLKMLSD
ncbi:unnamed protein product, partial [Acidithrix sp. C25]